MENKIKPCSNDSCKYNSKHTNATNCSLFLQQYMHTCVGYKTEKKIITRENVDSIYAYFCRSTYVYNKFPKNDIWVSNAVQLIEIQEEYIKQLEEKNNV